MQVSQIGTQPRIHVVQPGDIYYDEEASQAAALVAEEVNQAYEQYRKAKEKRQDVVVNYPAAAKTAIQQEEFALGIFQNAVEKYQDQPLSEHIVALYNQSFDEEMSMSASGEEPRMMSASSGEPTMNANEGPSSNSYLDFVDRVGKGVAKDPKQQEIAAQLLAQLNKMLARLETLRLLLSTPAGGEKSGMRVEFNELIKEIGIFMAQFGPATGNKYTSGKTGAEGKAEAEKYIAEYYAGAEGTVKLVENPDGTFTVVHTGGKIFTSPPGMSDADAKKEAEKWAAEKFGQNAATTVKRNPDGTYSVLLDMTPFDKMREIFIDMRGKQGNGFLTPDQHSILETALDAQKKAFEAQLNKSIQIVGQGQEQMFAAIAALSAMIESILKVLLGLAPK